MNPFGPSGTLSEQLSGRETADRLSRSRAAFSDIRRTSESLAEPLSAEDCCVQSMPDTSPVKWHLAHTTWFFERFVLRKAAATYRPVHPDFEFLFNSYYNSVGERIPRSERGLMTQPRWEDVLDYRRQVDVGVGELLHGLTMTSELLDVLDVGLQHEQQHQELSLTDVQNLFSRNPLRPAYHTTPSDCHQRLSSPHTSKRHVSKDWLPIEPGLYRIGHAEDGFGFDNEFPEHQVYLQSAEIAATPVTAGEFLDFIEDDGYSRSELWLSDGWDMVQSEGWRAPLYWEPSGSGCEVFTLFGQRPVHPDEPVCHVSYYEADAFARWSNARLPTEAEWEVAVGRQPVVGNFVEQAAGHPQAMPDLADAGPLLRAYGDVWEWTASPYVAYPGYRAPAGALGEYNGKFMSNQMVLRGGSCASPRSHLRATYRNFFHPEKRWQFTGLRLARDL